MSSITTAARCTSLLCALLGGLLAAGCAVDHTPESSSVGAAEHAPAAPAVVGPGAGDLLGVAMFGMAHDVELRQIAAYRELTDRRRDFASADTAAR